MSVNASAETCPTTVALFEGGTAIRTAKSASARRRREISLPVLLAAAALAIWFCLRLVLLAHLDTGDIDLHSGLSALERGLWFDIATLGFLLPPFLLIAVALPNRFRSRRTVNALRWGVLWLSLALLLFGALAEITFWREFSSRFNFIAVDYLIYTQEVIGNIRESYPVGALLALIAALATLLTWLATKYFVWQDGPRTWRWRAIGAALVLILPLASLRLASVDQMSATGNVFADELSGNGLFSLAAAMRRNELDYARFYSTLPVERADAILAELRNHGNHGAPPPATAKNPLTGQHSTLPAPFIRKPKNVILISVESLSAEYLGVHGDTRGLTPNLDRLAGQGFRFERIFATGTRTVRGLEALSIGVPPLPGQSVVRRPNNEHLNSLGEHFEQQGIAPLFVYGGYGYFDNMNAYFAANDYRVIDRTDFPAESIAFENIWGVADESLFANASREFDKLGNDGKPFFAHIMTTSNHRPFTYPDGRIDIPSPGGRNGAVKYSDHAIGRFIEEARSKPWFKDTLFVITADHCASVAGKTQLPVAKYHIPLIFYAPDLLRPGTSQTMASQIDVAPTLLHALGLPGKEEFFGTSLLAPVPERSSRAFISNYQALGYYKNDMLTVLMPKRRVEAYRIAPDTLESSRTEPDPRLVEEAIAYYQTAAKNFKQGDLISSHHRATQ
jgi:phosphoglycerol transferase MdoB-like AlkP superfamily enzyme